MAADLRTRPATAPTPLRQRAWETLPFALAHFAACAFLKVSYLRHGGADAIATSLGPGSLSLLEYARLFAEQAVESLAIFPAVLLVSGYALGPRLRPWAFFACLEAAIGLTLIGWITYFTIGRFPTQEATREFINAYRANPEFVTPKGTVAFGLVVKGTGLLALGAFPLMVVRWERFRAARGRLRTIGLVVPLAGGMAGAFLVATTPVASVFHVSEVRRLLAETLESDPVELPRSTAVSAESIMSAYRRIAFPDGPGAEAGDPPPLAPPAAATPNVVFIVLETASLGDYDFLGPKPTMPRTAALLPHSLVAARHFATDPYSLRANFSLYSSVYDLRGRKPFSMYVAGQPGVRRLDSLPRLLRDRGYVTRYYYTHPFWPDADIEEAQIDYLGFEETYIYGFSREDGRRPPERNAHAERAMFEQVSRDLDDLHRSGRPFFLAVAGSIGHSPYFDLRSPDAAAADPVPRREVLVGNIVGLRDELVGSTVKALERLGMLEDTILVVTGDHGVRNVVDDPDFDTRYANERSYHVPFLIHYPRAFPSTVTVSEVTSHVDVAPTVLSLIGGASGPYLHQGTSLLDPSVRKRVTFFLGDHYTGCDAIHYDGRFFMVNSVARAGYASPRFSFSRDNLLTGAAPGASHRDRKFIDEELAGLADVQWRLIAYLREGEGPGARQDAYHGVVRTYLASDDGGVPAADRGIRWAGAVAR